MISQWNPKGGFLNHNSLLSKAANESLKSLLNLKPFIEAGGITPPPSPPVSPKLKSSGSKNHLI